MLRSRILSRAIFFINPRYVLHNLCPPKDCQRKSRHLCYLVTSVKNTFGAFLCRLTINEHMGNFLQAYMKTTPILSCWATRLPENETGAVNSDHLIQWAQSFIPARICCRFAEIVSTPTPTILSLQHHQRKIVYFFPCYWKETRKPIGHFDRSFSPIRPLG